MINLLRLLCAALIGLLRCSTRREAEILVLRHQLNVLKRQAPKRPNLRNLDRLLFIWLARLVPTTLGALKVVCTENWIRLDARQRLGNPARLMIELLRLILHIVTSLFKPRARLAAGILVLRQQLNVLRQQVSKRPQRSNTDRFLFVWLYRWFPSVLGGLLSSGRRQSSAGIARGSGRTGAGGHASGLAGRESRRSCAIS
jgi:hypothetical protein